MILTEQIILKNKTGWLMEGKGIGEGELRIISEFANCYDVVENMPKFIYSPRIIRDFSSKLKEIEKDLMEFLSKKINKKYVERLLKDNIEIVKKKRMNFGRYEVIPYFRRREIEHLTKLHRQTLDVAILDVLSREGIINLPLEERETIKNRIWLGLELKTFAMLGGLHIPDETTFSDEIIEKISEECVENLYRKIVEERKKYLKHIITVLDFRYKIEKYDLDPDLWQYFTVIEAVRLLGLTGEFVYDFIKLSELIQKMEGIEYKIEE